MKFSAARSELDSMVLQIERTLVSIIQGVALFFLIDNARVVLTTHEIAFWLYIPAGLLVIFVGLTVLTFLITSFGTTVVASYGVGSTILQVVMIPAMGLSMAISALVGQNIGAGNIDRAARIGRLGSWLGFGILTGLGVIAFAFPAPLVRFFVPNDPGVINQWRFYVVTNTTTFTNVAFATFVPPNLSVPRIECFCANPLAECWTRSDLVNGRNGRVNRFENASTGRNCGVGVDPVAWTLHSLNGRSSRCRNRDHRIRQNFASK